jgi:hypothetical protein
MKYRSKTYIIALLFFVVAFVMFFFVFDKLQVRNTKLSADVAAQRKTLEQLLQEQHSFEQGKKDIENLKTKKIQPSDLFSRDTRVVKEIKALENLSKIYTLEMNLQIAGTAKNAQKVKSFSQILSIPYTVTVTGPFDQVLAFLDCTENLNFVTPVKSIVISAQKSGGVKTLISSDFYIKQ